MIRAIKYYEGIWSWCTLGFLSLGVFFSYKVASIEIATYRPLIFEVAAYEKFVS